MKRLITGTAALVFLAGVSLVTIAQRPSSQLNDITDVIALYVQARKPEWRRNPVTAMSGSQSGKVVIQQWIFDDRVIKIAVLKHQSQAQAQAELRKFATDVKANVVTSNLGDEAYSWSVRRSIAFRKGNLTVYVSAVTFAGVEEEATLSKDFAQLVASALAAP